MRRIGAKWGRPVINWGLIATTAISAALIRVLPETSTIWLVVLYGSVLAQIGKDFWKDRKDKRRIQSEDFFKKYTAQVGDVVAIMGDIDDYSEEQARLAQCQTLKTICALVAVYYKNDSDKLREKFNASLMLPEPGADWIEEKNGHFGFREAVHFFDANRNARSCATILHLTCWARQPSDWAEFALAVDCDEDYLLPGAPRAFAQKQLQVISDTLSITELNQGMSKQAETAKRELRNYFERSEKEFRSFFSLPLVSDGSGVGVLNVQSREIDILGVDEEHKEDLELCLRPFCAVLCALIEREKRHL